MVFKNAFTACPSAWSDEPALNPNQPSHNKAAPSNTNGMLAGPAAEQSLGMPCHVGQRTIYHEEEKHHEEHISGKPHPFGKRTRNERGGDDGKFHLEQREERQWDCSTTQYVSCRSGINTTTHTLKHQERQRIAYHTADVVAKAKRESYNHPQDRNQAHGDKRLEHGGNHILRSYHATIEKRQSRCHHQHKDGGGNQPSHIGCRNHRPVTLKGWLSNP